MPGAGMLARMRPGTILTLPVFELPETVSLERDQETKTGYWTSLQYLGYIVAVEDSKEPTREARRLTVSANSASISSSCDLETMFSMLDFNVTFSVSSPTLEASTVIYSLPASSKLYFEGKRCQRE